MSEIEPTQTLTQMDRETAFAAIDAAVELLTATMHPDARRLRDAGAVLRGEYGRGLEDAAKVAETCPNVLHFWDRPGGPPGNGFRPPNAAEIAEQIRTLGRNTK